jgi:parallel beta-helix repeat protein
MLLLFALSTLTLASKTQPAWAHETIYIRGDGSIDPPSAPISSIDDVTYRFSDNIYASIVIERDHIVVDGSGYRVQGDGSFGSTGLNLSGRSNVTIINMTISLFWYAVYLDHSHANVISGNCLANNTYIGIYAQESSNNSFFSNNITANNGLGLYLVSSHNNTVEMNNVTANMSTGIIIQDSNFCIVRMNVFINNSCAIDTVNSDYIQISGNTVADNHGFGIRMEDLSDNNLVADNNITNSGDGIWTHATGSHIIIHNTIALNARGFALYGQPGGYNTILHNDIVRNTVGVYLWKTISNQFVGNNFIDNGVQVLSEGFANSWNDSYAVGGNYWSDYDGTDLHSGLFQNESGSDGIGDTRYTIDSTNADNYPLTGTFSVFSATSKYQVQTISNSSISDFTFNDTAVSFNVTGEDGTTGFCRVCLPTALMNDTYKVFVNGTEALHRLLPCSNSTNNYLYFTYGHSTQEVIVIPELSLTFNGLLMVSATIAFLLARRKLTTAK